MEYNYFVYNKPECAIKINKMPAWYKEIEYEGDGDQGFIILHSQNEYDEIWGPDSKMEINWEKKEKMNFFYSIPQFTNKKSLSVNVNFVKLKIFLSRSVIPFFKVRLGKIKTKRPINVTRLVGECLCHLAGDYRDAMVITSNITSMLITRPPTHDAIRLRQAPLGVGCRREQHCRAPQEGTGNDPRDGV